MRRLRMGCAVLACLVLATPLTGCGASSRPGSSPGSRTATPNATSTATGQDAATQRIAKLLANGDTAPEMLRAAKCIAHRLVTRAGLARLRDDGVLDAQDRLVGSLNGLSLRTAEIYAGARMACTDIDAERPFIKASSGATDAQVDAFIACFNAINESDLRKSLAEQASREPAKLSARARAAVGQVSACQKLLTGGDAPELE